MVEHKAHATAVPSQEAVAAAERDDKFVETAVQHVGQDRALDMALEAFDQIETR